MNFWWAEMMSIVFSVIYHNLPLGLLITQMFSGGYTLSQSN